MIQYRTTPLLLASVLVLPGLPAVGQAPAPSRPSSGGAPGVTTPPAPSDPPTAARLTAQARELVGIVARMRGLRAKRRVAMGVMTRQQIMTEIRARLAQDYSEDEVRTEAAILKRLGLLPLHLNYKQAVLELLTDQVAGFYHPQKKQLNIARWLPLALQKPTLAHEICHALQDQHFNLKRFVRPIKDNGDRQLARAALVEGDCTGIMLEYVLAPSGVDLSAVSGAIDTLISGMIGSGSAKFRSTPRFLRETLTFPYLHGLRFIQRLRTKRSWSAVNRLFRRPPSTTEQLLHFDKYVRRERPRAIRVRPIATLGAYRLLKRDTLGEFQLRLLLRQALDEPAATRAAAGWDGDRLAAYRRREEAARSLPLLVHLSSWDSKHDASEFFAAAQRLLTRLTGPRAASQDALVVYRDREQQEWSLERRGDQVLLLVAAPPMLRAQLQQQVWQRWRH